MSDQTNDESQNQDPGNADEYLSQLVGEGKKYSTPDELAKAYLHADLTIEQFKQSNDHLKEELNKRMTLEDLLKENEDRKQVQPEEVKDDPPAVEPKPEDQDNPKVEDANDDLEAKIRDILNKDRESRTIEENSDQVFKTLMETYGEKSKVQEELTRKAEQLGIGVDFLLATGEKSPQALYDLLGIASKQPSNKGASKGDLNAQAFETHRPNNNGPKPGTYAHYDLLRKEDPRKYFSAPVQRKMLEDRMKMGDDFYSN